MDQDLYVRDLNNEIKKLKRQLKIAEGYMLTAKEWDKKYGSPVHTPQL